MYMQKMMGNEVGEPIDIPLYEMVTEANRDDTGGIYTTNLRYVSRGNGHETLATLIVLV